MAIKKSLEQVLIFISGAIVIAIIFGVFDTFLKQRDYDKEKERMKKDIIELKESYKAIIKTTTETNNNVIILTTEVKHLAIGVRELKAEVKGSYAKNIEENKARIRTDEQNIKIASSSL